MALITRTFSMDNVENDRGNNGRKRPMTEVKESQGEVPSKERKRRAEVNTQNEEIPLWTLPSGFNNLSERQQFLERRALHNKLLEHYKNVKHNLPMEEQKKIRPDMQVMKQMKEDETSFNYKRLVHTKGVYKGYGHTPGVKVGDSFRYMSEMYVLGLHGEHQAGIACVKQRGEEIACSVVITGSYEDDGDSEGERIIYCGHGGNDYKGDRRQKEDQDRELKGKNKALYNGIERKICVRVIWGCGEGAQKYSYCGLYTVTEHKYEKGKEGYYVNTFVLMREPNQPALDPKIKAPINGQRRNCH